MDADRKPFSVVLAIAYAPIGAAKEVIHQDSATQVERCFNAPKSDQVLLMGINANASTSMWSDNCYLVLWP
jgi:hypothetical protein